MKKTSTLLVPLVSLAVVAFAGWRVYAMKREPVNHFAILEDPSLSYTGRCQATVGSAEHILRGPRVSRGSKLILLVLGDSRTANEPRELGKYDMPISSKVIEGRKANERRQQALLQEISNKCRSIGSTSLSPIFIGVRQAIADLRGEGCTEISHCELWVSSDLEENVEAGIKGRLSRTPRQGPLPAALDNNGIDVTFCGYATTAGQTAHPRGREVRRFTGRSSARDDRLQGVWTSLLTNPERVRFQPYCPSPSSLETH
jgi:hypothetical protein